MFLASCNAFSRRRWLFGHMTCVNADPSPLQTHPVDPHKSVVAQVAPYNQSDIILWRQPADQKNLHTHGLYQRLRRLMGAMIAEKHQHILS